MLPSCLKSLNFFISCPKLDTIFPSASPFTGLEELLITKCSELETLPDRIGHLLPCLRKLVIHALVGLIRLELTECWQLSGPPAGLPPSLETLCLGPFREEDSSHVVDISGLSQLRVLKLNCVVVRCGPAVSSMLPCLQQLEQLEMRLERDSEELLIPLMLLPRLRSMLIEAPDICSLPENLATVLPELRQLELRSWSPEELPGSIVELSSLTTLIVNAPQLTSLPQGMSRLSRLRKLELIRCTALQHLPECLTQLHRLILHGTSVSSLPADFVQLTAEEH
ncbi:unnamed protein product [Closterium sp. Naga37s-1]|nr:unnamed protein product [Closterium sp. Naga37s-1]